MDLYKLKGKITSREQLVEIAGCVSIDKIIRGPLGHGDPWWISREYFRVDLGIYQTTSILDKINNSENRHLCVHVSTEDATMVAYTADAAAGESDRQLKINLGRLINKLYPYLPPEKVQEHVATHFSELSTEVEFITGQEISDAYATGPASCMKRGSSTPWAINPTTAYDAPNIRLAVLRDKEGNINARCLVYEPSETDKRMIRPYGDQLLDKRLRRLGYKPGTFHGAVFNTVKIEDKDTCNKYAMPYLDGLCTSGSAGSSAVALIDGKLHSVTEQQASNIRRVSSASVTIATGTSGYVTLISISSAEFRTTDCITGKSLNLLVDKTLKILMPDLTVGITKSPEGDTAESTCDWIAAKYLVNGIFDSILVHPEIPTFVHRYTIYVDNDEVRRYIGHYKLDPRFYPDDTGWYDSALVKVQENNFGILKQHLASVVVRNGTVVTTKPVHISSITKKHVKLHSIKRDSPLYAEDASLVVKTTSGRKVVPGIHEVSCLTLTGEWMFSRYTREYFYAGNTLLLESKEPVTSALLLDCLRKVGPMPNSRFIYYLGNEISGATVNGTHIYINRMRDGVPPVTMYDFMLAVSRIAGLRGKPLALYWLECYHDATAVEYPSPAPLVEIITTQETEQVGEPA